MLPAAGKTVWVVTDGGFTQRPFVRPLLAEGVTLVGRLRKDSALRDPPPPVRPRGRGRPRVYGVNRLSPAKRAAHRDGRAEVTYSVCGVEVTKTVKTFLATHATFGGTIRVVIVKEPTGPQFFYCTDPAASVRDLVEACADRSTIETARPSNRSSLTCRVVSSQRQGSGGAVNNRSATCGRTSASGT